jgi:cell division protein FtsW (lipid II flippase)
MFETIKESLGKWQSNNDDRTKLQHTYIAAALGLLVAAGIIGLMNRDLGQNILIVAIISAGIFLVNAVVWSLVQSAVISRATIRSTTSTKKK